MFLRQTVELIESRRVGPRKRTVGPWKKKVSMKHWTNLVKHEMKYICSVASVHSVTHVHTCSLLLVFQCCNVSHVKKMYASDPILQCTHVLLLPGVPVLQSDRCLHSSKTCPTFYKMNFPNYLLISSVADQHLQKLDEINLSCTSSCTALNYTMVGAMNITSGSSVLYCTTQYCSIQFCNTL